MNPQMPNPPQGMPPNPGLPPVAPSSGGQQPFQPPYQQLAGKPASGKKHHPWGLIIALVVFVLAFLGSSGFGFWAYAQMQDYKNNVDEKVAVAVDAAVKQAEETKEKEFLERSKSPYKKYKGPATFGAVEITYPRTWAATVSEASGNTPVSGYFHPDYVPGPKSETAFALRVEVLEQPYDRILGSYDANAKKGTIKVAPFKAKRVPSVLGARIDGEIEKGFQGSSILLPLRDKTIRITTLSGKSFGADFNKVVLENLIFTP
ncbi:MAG TPA: hypothetical protein VK674_01425 [Candidatus Limnocylindria bacterium]|nr:hypothetical protein [Candidatus Limnocylindria bacterium]